MQPTNGTMMDIDKFKLQVDDQIQLCLTKERELELKLEASRNLREGLNIAKRLAEKLEKEMNNGK